MKDIAIKVENLGKRYRIGSLRGSYGTLRDGLADAPRAAWQGLKALFSGAAPGAGTEEFWALRGVEFEVERGQVLGVIGRNGAGKSTFLKMLCRVTEPTEGRATLWGRVGALLEVGTGFHPELTGRDNIYLSGAILGMSRSEIRKKFDDIVAFAEIERFLETPVKRYSSGMYVRLGFAVAAHLEPDVLLVDEVLAVGDSAFQKRCLGKMDQVAGSGRTVLFVSHNLQTISALTQRCVLLDKGRMAYLGDTSSTLARYRSLWGSQNPGEYVDPSKSFGVRRVEVITSESGQIHRFGQPLSVNFELDLKEKLASGAFAFQIVDEQEKPIVHLWLFDSDRRWSRPGKIALRCVIENPRLYMGRYTVKTYLGDRASSERLETLDGLCPFEVVMDGVPREFEWVPGTCAYLERAEWDVT